MINAFEYSHSLGIFTISHGISLINSLNDLQRIYNFP